MRDKVFVTGAGGFIGSTLIDHLVKSGEKVTALVHYNSSGSVGWLSDLEPEVLEDVDVVRGDIRDESQMRSLLSGHDCVFHLAALIGIPYSYIAPRSYLDVNAGGTLNLLVAAREAGVSRFVHTSTSEVYGSAEFVPISEQHPQRGQSPYAASKIAADQMAYSFALSFGMPLVIVRPFNTYGPRQSARAVIPSIISQALGGSGSIRAGNLETTRDFTFVDDTVRGLMAASKEANITGEVVNLGSNFEVSIAETISIIGSLMGRELSVVSAAERLRPERSEVLRLWSDNRKALSVLNWSPTLHGLDGFREGLAKTIRWFESNLSDSDSNMRNFV